MTLTRNTGRTPGHSSRRAMAFRSNTLARAPPGAPGEAHQLCTLPQPGCWGPGLQASLLPGPSGRGARPLSRARSAPPVLGSSSQQLPSHWLWHLLTGAGADHSPSSPSAPAPLVGTRQLTPHWDWTLEFREVLRKHSTSALRPPGLALGTAAWGPLSSNSQDWATS